MRIRSLLILSEKKRKESTIKMMNLNFESKTRKRIQRGHWLWGGKHLPKKFMQIKVLLDWPNLKKKMKHLVYPHLSHLFFLKRVLEIFSFPKSFTNSDTYTTESPFLVGHFIAFQSSSDFINGINRLLSTRDTWPFHRKIMQRHDILISYIVIILEGGNFKHAVPPFLLPCPMWGKSSSWTWENWLNFLMLEHAINHGQTLGIIHSLLTRILGSFFFYNITS